MGSTLKNTVLYLLLMVFSSITLASSKQDTYLELQNLKTDVHAAYVYALIVDKDGRAHPQRNARLEKIENFLNKIEKLEDLDKEHKAALSMTIRVYLRSAKNEAATYDEILGSRTFTNGYSTYSDLIEQIFALTQLIESSENFPKRTVEAFSLLGKVNEAIELHGERSIKTERVAKTTQNDLSSMCLFIEKNLTSIASYPETQSIVKNAALKWTYIKTPICKLDKTSAPYTITHYGFLMSDIINQYAASNLIASQ